VVTVLSNACLITDEHVELFRRFSARPTSIRISPMVSLFLQPMAPCASLLCRHRQLRRTSHPSRQSLSAPTWPDSPCMLPNGFLRTTGKLWRGCCATCSVLRLPKGESRSIPTDGSFINCAVPSPGPGERRSLSLIPSTFSAAWPRCCPGPRPMPSAITVVSPAAAPPDRSCPSHRSGKGRRFSCRSQSKLRSRRTLVLPRPRALIDSTGTSYCFESFT
jgi:hypothetical protein